MATWAPNNTSHHLVWLSLSCCHWIFSLRLDAICKCADFIAIIIQDERRERVNSCRVKRSRKRRVASCWLTSLPSLEDFGGQQQPCTFCARCRPAGLPLVVFPPDEFSTCASELLDVCCQLAHPASCDYNDHIMNCTSSSLLISEDDCTIVLCMARFSALDQKFRTDVYHSSACAACMRVMDMQQWCAVVVA